MKNNFLETFSYLQKNNSDSKTLLKNCGFSPNFFYDLERNALTIEENDIKKIKSANDIKLLQMQDEKINQKKIYEAEDKDIFNKRFDRIKNNLYLNYCNNSTNNISSYTTIPSKDCSIKNIYEITNKKNNNNFLINAYKSKHKKKYSKLYEINSIILEEKNKNKLYHKCCYPGCNRTFSSSGWLKAHLKEHLKQIHNSKYCKLFEKFVLSAKVKSLKKKKDFFYEVKNNNNIINSHLDLSNNCQNINMENTNNNKNIFYTGLNSPKLPGFLVDNDIFFNNENNHLCLNNYNNENYKINYNQM